MGTSFEGGAPSAKGAVCSRPERETRPLERRNVKIGRCLASRRRKVSRLPSCDVRRHERSRRSQASVRSFHLPSDRRFSASCSDRSTDTRGPLPAAAQQRRRRRRRRQEHFPPRSARARLSFKQTRQSREKRASARVKSEVSRRKNNLSLSANRRTLSRRCFCPSVLHDCSSAPFPNRALAPAMKDSGPTFPRLAQMSRSNDEKRKRYLIDKHAGRTETAPRETASSNDVYKRCAMMSVNQRRNGGPRFDCDSIVRDNEASARCAG